MKSDFMGRELRLVESGTTERLPQPKYSNPAICSWNLGYFTNGEAYSSRGSNHSKAALKEGVAQNS